MFQGYKTYIVATLMGILVLIRYYFNEISVQGLIEGLAEAAGLAALRSGMNQTKYIVKTPDETVIVSNPEKLPEVK